MTHISFSVNDTDRKLISEIVDRAVDLAGGKYMTWNMDITAAHANGNPLDLSDLLAADNFNFAHDVLGIRQHINRNTGKLENCFVPRYSSRKVTA